MKFTPKQNYNSHKCRKSKSKCNEYDPREKRVAVMEGRLGLVPRTHKICDIKNFFDKIWWFCENLDFGEIFKIWNLKP